MNAKDPNQNENPLLKNSLKVISQYHGADYVYFVAIKSYLGTFPVIFYEKSLNELSIDIEGVNLSQVSAFPNNGELVFIRKLINISPTRKLKFYGDKPSPFAIDAFFTSNLFATKKGWIDVRSTQYAAVKINKYLNGVLCLGSKNEGFKFLAELQSDYFHSLPGYIFSVTDSLLKGIENLSMYSQKSRKVDLSTQLYNRALFEASNENSEDPNYASELAKKATELLQADRTHVFVKNNDELQLVGRDKKLHSNPAFFLKDQENAGNQTWMLIRNAEKLIKNNSKRSKYVLSESNCISTVYDLQNERTGFANRDLAIQEGLHSMLTVLLYDQDENKVLGVMNIFSQWEEPMFDYRINELMSLAKIATKQLQKLSGRRMITELESSLLDKGLIANGEVPASIKSTQVKEGIENLKQLIKLYGKGYVEHKEKKVSVEEFEQALLFRQNCDSLHLDSLILNDVNFFSDTQWFLNNKMNIILGNNGYGKSYLLRTIVSLLQNKVENLRQFFSDQPDDVESFIQLNLIKEPHRQKPEISSIYFNEADFRKEDGIGKGVFPVLAIPDVRSVRQSGSIGGIFGHLNGDLKRIGAAAFLNRQPFENFIEEFLNDLCLTYFESYTGLLKKEFARADDSPPIHAATHTKENLLAKAFHHPKLDFLKKVMHDLTGDESFSFVSIEHLVNSSGYRFLVKTSESNSPVPIQQLSQGSMSILAIFGIIFRFLDALYPRYATKKGRTVRISSSAADMKCWRAVVFIDEIDAHLHPSWQQKILFLLQEYFPEVQFIVTAHSPLVVAGARAGQVSVLRNEDGKYALRNSYRDYIGVETIDIYRTLFEIEDHDLNYLKYVATIPTIRKKEKRLEELTKQTAGNLSKEQELELTELREELEQVKRFVEKFKII
ncbi:AAA family ATPase [Dyadobacter chenwenxiniae]|uniref:AAA family ATPase n=1 Tax=Dyadobacter chenwenxiniae TaxID=2906456 RepID=A0A9X1PKV6_9BACT|nr:AAA family ATPase [Dyadobacter chenwenxiniae]MCF0061353.1 AAA family ATPase [Dyadobacter chenwenxiniae]UON81175.1 AAA family ATPase [Dyadobacter chenwenxiniae]